MSIWKIGAVGGGFILAALFSAAEESPPPHPTMLLAEYKGTLHQVVAVETEDPVIVVDGRKKHLRGNIPLSAERLARYRGTKAELTAVKVEGVRVVSALSEMEKQEAAAGPHATLGGYVEFAATITAAQDLSDCFIALFACDEDFMRGTSNQPKASIRIRQIQNLRAREATSIKFSATPFLNSGRLRVFALLFSEGHEVAVNSAPSAWQYFSRREHVVHEAAVSRWLQENGSGSRAAQPLLQIPPLFESTGGFPPKAAADLTVAADGTVRHVALDRPFSPEAKDVITRALGAWLFLPKIHEGVPMLTHVVVPLRF